MELIPILSLIVLVATISTFIFAIGAYVLYKIRESKGRKTIAPAPRTIEAELYTPQARGVQYDMPMQQQRQVAYQEPVYQDPVSQQGRPAAYQQVQNERAYNQMPPVTAPSQEYRNNGNGNGYTEAAEDQEKNKKFMKYTSEGYVPVNKSTKTGENLKWR
jgi:hypothetical protein